MKMNNVLPTLEAIFFKYSLKLFKRGSNYRSMNCDEERVAQTTHLEIDD